MKLFLDPVERGVNNLAEAGQRLGWRLGSVGQSDGSFTKTQPQTETQHGTDVVPSICVAPGKAERAGRVEAAR